MTFSKPQQKLEHKSNPAYQRAHGYAPEAEEALAWVLLETVSFPSSFWSIWLIELPLLLLPHLASSDANLSHLAVKPNKPWSPKGCSLNAQHQVPTKSCLLFTGPVRRSKLDP